MQFAVGIQSHAHGACASIERSAPDFQRTFGWLSGRLTSDAAIAPPGGRSLSEHRTDGSRKRGYWFGRRSTRKVGGTHCSLRGLCSVNLVAIPYLCRCVRVRYFDKRTVWISGSAASRRPGSSCVMNRAIPMPQRCNFGTRQPGHFLASVAAESVGLDRLSDPGRGAEKGARNTAACLSGATTWGLEPKSGCAIIVVPCPLLLNHPLPHTSSTPFGSSLAMRKTNSMSSANPSHSIRI